jgi:hypothetical protein
MKARFLVSCSWGGAEGEGSEVVKTFGIYTQREQALLTIYEQKTLLPSVNSGQLAFISGSSQQSSLPILFLPPAEDCGWLLDAPARDTTVYFHCLLICPTPADSNFETPCRKDDSRSLAASQLLLRNRVRITSTLSMPHREQISRIHS